MFFWAPHWRISLLVKRQVQSAKMTKKVHDFPPLFCTTMNASLYLVCLACFIQRLILYTPMLISKLPWLDRLSTEILNRHPSSNNFIVYLCNWPTREKSPPWEGSRKTRPPPLSPYKTKMDVYNAFLKKENVSSTLQQCGSFGSGGFGIFVAPFCSVNTALESLYLSRLLFLTTSCWTPKRSSQLTLKKQ